MPAFFYSILFILFFLSSATAQTHSPDTLIARLGYRQCIVTARQFEGDSVVNLGRHVQIIGPNGRTQTYTTYDKNGKMWSRLVYEYDTLNHMEIQHDYDKNGQLEYVHLDVFGSNFHQRYQIRSEDGDTLSSGKWVRDVRGRDSLFYQFGKLNTRYRYNALGDLVEKKKYGPDGKSNGTWRYVVKRKGNLIETWENDNGTLYLTEKRSETPKKTVDYVLKTSTGYLYGIVLHSEKGGTRTLHRDKDGLVTAIVYETAKGKVHARIDFEYVKFP